MENAGALQVKSCAESLLIAALSAQAARATVRLYQLRLPVPSLSIQHSYD
jgi:hypothetical protein